MSQWFSQWFTIKTVPRLFEPIICTNDSVNPQTAPPTGGFSVNLNKVSFNDHFQIILRSNSVSITHALIDYIIYAVRRRKNRTSNVQHVFASHFNPKQLTKKTALFHCSPKTLSNVTRLSFYSLLRVWEEQQKYNPVFHQALHKTNKREKC